MPRIGSATSRTAINRTFLAGVYFTGMAMGTDGTAGLTQNLECAIRFEVGEIRTFDRIGIEVTTAAASNVVRLGIRPDSSGYPSATVTLDAGTIDASTTGYKEQPISQQLTPGRWWLTATLQGGTGASVRARSLDTFIGQTVTTTTNPSSYCQTGITGALPSSFSSTVIPTTGPKILVRAV